MRGRRRRLAGVTLSASQLVVPGRAGTITPAKLSPTAHPPVPNDLSSMWLVPAQNAKLGPALTNFVRGVRAARGRRPRRRSAAARERRRALDHARCGLRALLHRPRLDEARSVCRGRQRVRRSRRAPDRRTPARGCGVSARRNPRNAEGLQGRGRGLRIAGAEEAGAAAAGVAAPWPRRRSRRPADAIGRSACSAPTTTSRRRRKPIRPGRRSTSRTSISKRRLRQRNWRAPKRCSRRGDGRAPGNPTIA